MKTLLTHPTIKALEKHYESLKQSHMRNWFKEDPHRYTTLSLSLPGLLLDYSKNRIQPETLRLLCDFALSMKLPQKIEALFQGESINFTENRPALHTALRDLKASSLIVHGKNIMPDIHAALKKMRAFTELVRNGLYLGATQKPIRSIVNIGVGGSHLGPLMATHALSDFATTSLRCHFISNLDSAHLNHVLKQIDPETTLFIISSKSFTTLETMTNALTLRTWLKEKLGETAIATHFIAVTAKIEKAKTFGIPETSIFPLWDFVGGRYSLWSAIGLPLALMIGMDAFEDFLKGGHYMDQHFRHAPFSKNMPVILGLLSFWYIHFFEAKSHAIIPYAHHLQHFREHLQQLEMESNGKNIDADGTFTDYTTGPVLWGEQGCNGQHAVHQLLHQGSHVIPVDFILIGKNPQDVYQHQDMLVASALSQSKALMQGRTYEEANSELCAQGLPSHEAAELAKFKVIPGNRPNTLLFVDEMTPFYLGMLLALYEHKVFVQGALWNINSFDQWGVELGKELLPDILNQMHQSQWNTQQDGSTAALIQHYHLLKEKK